MIIELKAPGPGESINEVEIAAWHKADGDYVEKNDQLCSIESDKVTLSLDAEQSGVLKILVEEGETVSVGAVVCTIDTEGKPARSGERADPGKTEEGETKGEEKISRQEPKTGAGRISPGEKNDTATEAAGVKPEKLFHYTGKSGVQDHVPADAVSPGDPPQSKPVSGELPDRVHRREKMSQLRKKVSGRLVAVKNETAMLTTFNDVDMSRVIQLRNTYKEEFESLHNVGLGFMSFFVRAVTESIKHYPAINAMIDGDDIVYHDFVDIGIAVSTPRGLMVPVLRNAESMTFAEIETAIKNLATRARDGKITLEEITGGTFTITNGGVFGSLLSTPILNPPQSAILGLHRIADRPVAVNGNVEIRPMMYVALSYDHRIIDGKESVGFLVSIKEILDNPDNLLIGT